jgi:hypothetical protein
LQHLPQIRTPLLRVLGRETAKNLSLLAFRLAPDSAVLPLQGSREC